jgi:tellurite resistance protein TehA-like permease
VLAGLLLTAVGAATVGHWVRFPDRVRTARRGLPFSLTWWSFTFPVGTVVTGTSALAITTGTDLFRVAAAVFFIGLLAAWITVAARTTYGTWTGELLR